jgi:hypothetical protein
VKLTRRDSPRFSETPAAERSPDEVCDGLLRAAAGGGGPLGVEGWQEDRTVLAFAVGDQDRRSGRPDGAGGLG